MIGRVVYVTGGKWQVGLQWVVMLVVVVLVAVGWGALDGAVTEVKCYFTTTALRNALKMSLILESNCGVITLRIQVKR